MTESREGAQREEAAMAFIRTIPPSEAEGPVREMYQQAQSRFGYVANWVQAFSLRPGVRDGWVSLAHGSVLADKVFDAATVAAIATGAPEAPLEPGERAVMAFAEKVARNADQIASADVEVLRSHGYRDEEIFDLAAAAAARCFFSKLLDALGVQPDSSFNDLDPTLRRAQTVGRPVADRPGARLPAAGS